MRPKEGFRACVRAESCPILVSSLARVEVLSW
jgi:hypothetical protein